MREVPAYILPILYIHQVPVNTRFRTTKFTNSFNTNIDKYIFIALVIPLLSYKSDLLAECNKFEAII